MRQAIVTKYLGPTNSRGSRVKATADAGSITVPWDHALNVDANHAMAALALIHKLGWHGEPWYARKWAAGSLPPSYGGNVYVSVPGTEGTGPVEVIP